MFRTIPEWNVEEETESAGMGYRVTQGTRYEVDVFSNIFWAEQGDFNLVVLLVVNFGYDRDCRGV